MHASDMLLIAMAIVIAFLCWQAFNDIFRSGR